MENFSPSTPVSGKILEINKFFCSVGKSTNYAAVSGDGETFNVYHNKGRSIIDQFCEGEFCEANKGTTFIAHNAKGYDAQFIRCVSEWSQNRGIEDPGIQCELHSSILSAFPKVGLAGKCDFVDLVSFE